MKKSDQLKRKNLAVLLALLVFILALFAVSIIKMSS